MRAKRSLLEHDVVVEDLGGDVQCVEVSALHAKNLPALQVGIECIPFAFSAHRLLFSQEALLIQSDLMGLQSTPKGLVEGVVIESSVVQGLLTLLLPWRQRHLIANSYA